MRSQVTPSSMVRCTYCEPKYTTPPLGETSMGDTRWKRYVSSLPGLPYSDCAPIQYCFSCPVRSDSRLNRPLQPPYTVSGRVGCGMMGPVSHPGPCRQLCTGSSTGVAPTGRLGTMTVVLSCCAPYTR